MARTTKPASLTSRIYKNKNSKPTSQKTAQKKNIPVKQRTWKFYLTIVFWIIPLLLSGYIYFFERNKLDDLSHIHDSNTVEKNQLLEELIQEESGREVNPPVAQTFPQSLEQSLPSIPWETNLSQERQIKIYFVTIDQKNLEASLKPVKRKVLKGENPIESMMSLLLSGPSRWERDHGFQSVIPEGTKLLNYGITNGILVLDFNENFQMNPYGYPGVQLQVAQIVKTFTDWPEIQTVIFRINGEKTSYIDSEGYMPNQEFTSQLVKEKVHL